MDRVYFQELKCFQLAAEGECHRQVSSESCFRLDGLPKGVQEELRGYILHRGEHLKLSSIFSERSVCSRLCKFLREEYRFESLLDQKLDITLRQLQRWLLKNGYIVASIRKNGCGGTYRSPSPVLQYLQNLIVFLTPEQGEETEKDIWRLDNLGFPVRRPLAHTRDTLNFIGIPQEGIRREIKEACEVALHYRAVSTVAGYIFSVRRLAGFLQKKYPEIQSLKEMDREILEHYFLYIYTEVQDKKNFHSELSHLKMALELVENICEYDSLQSIFYEGDVPRTHKAIYHTYSDIELRRINAVLVEGDAQIARALFLQQMLANRISETLTLERDCVMKRGEHIVVRVFQEKTRRICYKPANEDVVKLISAAIAYTQEMYGDTKYVFVAVKNPERPMRTHYLWTKYLRILQEKGLQDEFSPKTHIFRHSYGKRLTEMHIDDYTIAKLLGHANTRTVSLYRRCGDQLITEETQKTRTAMNQIIHEIAREWL